MSLYMSCDAQSAQYCYMFSSSMAACPDETSPASPEASNGAAPVLSCEDAFRWATECLGYMQKDFGDQASLNDKVAQRLPGYTMSSAFSGVGAPEHACECIRAALQARAGVRAGDCVRDMGHIFAVEWSVQGQRELQMLPSPPTCIFSDMNSVWEPAVQRSLFNAAKSGALRKEDYLNIMQTGTAVVRQAPCVVHGALCPTGVATIHCAGPPCVDWSSQGTRSGELGPTMLPTMAWVAQRRALEEAIVAHENVKQYPVEFLEYFLGDKYLVQTCLVNAKNLGWPVVRVRRITLLLHKGKIRAILRPWPDIASGRCHRECRTTWRSFLCASPAELQEELEWAQSRPGSLFHLATLSDAPQLAVQPGDPEERQKGKRELAAELDVFWNKSAFTKALTYFELQNLRNYVRFYGGDRVYSLGQDALTHKQLSSTTHLHTLIKNVGMLFSWPDLRWLTPVEVLMFQGFPIPKHVKAHGERTSFEVPRSTRSRRAMLEQAGNSMHVNVMGVAVLWALSYVELEQPRSAGTFFEEAAALAATSAGRKRLRGAPSLGGPHGQQHDRDGDGRATRPCKSSE